LEKWASIYQACQGSVGIAYGYFWCYVEDWEHWSPKENFAKVRIWCITDKVGYASLAEAEQKTGISHTHISQCLNNKRKTAGGKEWCRYEEKDTWVRTKSIYPNQRAVWCVETATKYDSCAEAALAINSTSSEVSAVCRRENKTCNGYHLCYYEDKELYVTPEKVRNANYKQVKCIETGVIYSTIAEAERKTGVPRNDISATCRGRQKTAGGYQWEYVENE
jgi:hypothetical protein